MYSAPQQYPQPGGMQLPPPRTITPPQPSLFSQFIAKEGLLKVEALDNLPPLKEGGKPTIGIDGNKLLDILGETVRVQEPLAFINTALPFSIFGEIASLKERLIAKNAKLVFVFNGISFKNHLPPPPAHSAPRMPEACKLKGSEMDSVLRMPPQLTEMLKVETSHFGLDEDSENYIVLHLKAFADIDVVRAPYWSWAQMACFLVPGNKCLSDVYGCLELLAFEGVDRLITKFNFPADQFEYVRKADVLSTLRNKYSLTDLTEADLAAMIALDSKSKLMTDGFIGSLPSYPTSFQDLYKPRARGGSAVSGLLDQAPKSSPIRELHTRNVAAIQCCPVLTAAGECKSLCTLFGKQPLGGIGQFLGNPLPASYYYFLMMGPLTPHVLSTVANKQIVDSGPLIECKEFRACAEFVVPLRTQVVYQVVQSLSQNVNFQQGYEIMWLRKYNLVSGREIPILQPPQIKLDEWRMQPDFRPTPPAQQIYFSDVLQFSANAQSGGCYDSVFQFSAAIHLKTLDLLGYFTHATQTNSMEVSGPSVFSTALSQCDFASLSEYAVLLIELIRTRTLTDDPLTLQPHTPLQQLPPGVYFAIRLLTMIPVTLSRKWTGPMSAQISAYVSMVRSLSRTLRTLCEVVAVLIVSEGNCRFPVKDLRNIEWLLPFTFPPEAYTGIIMQHVLTCDPKFLSFANLEQMFPEVSEIKNSLYSIFYFWWYSVNIIELLYRDDAITYEKPRTSAKYIHGEIAKRAVILFGQEAMGFLHGAFQMQ
jgi:hypothetical protein